MWFKNLVLYRLPTGWNVSASELEASLEQRPLRPCGQFDMETRGWIAPADDGRLLFTANGQFLVALGVEQKLLPASIVRQVAKERAVELEKEQGHPVGRRQMREIKLRVTDELRARALSRRKSVCAWIDPANGWCLVDAAGTKQAEELIETLRETIGTFAVTPYDTERSPRASMGTWLSLGDAPLGFSIDQDLELVPADGTKASIRYTRHPLDGKEIRGHLQAGKVVSKLGLTWKDRVAFMLSEKLEVKRLQFLAVEEDADGDGDSEPEAQHEKFAADFTLMTGELAQLLAQLNEALGGGKSVQAEAA
jgi:recombination associated protein RdgC